MRFLLLTVVIAALPLSACTGTRMLVTPDSTAVQTPVARSGEKVGLRAASGGKTYPPAGNLTEGFSSYLAHDIYPDGVFYPARPDDKVDYTLDSKFSVEMDPHTGSLIAKSFFTGLTLFLLEPLLWYDFDYTVTAEVTVLKDGKPVSTLNKETTARMGAKWLSLSEIPRLEGEVLDQAKASIYKQLANDLPPTTPAR
jgi:hypothetical protein